MKPVICFGVLIHLASLVTGQSSDTFDDAHKCQSFRGCKDCFTTEFCLDTMFTLFRWWTPCPYWAPYCNPYSQACERTITSECQSAIPATTTRPLSSTSTSAPSTTASTPAVTSTPESTTRVETSTTSGSTTSPQPATTTETASTTV